MATPYDVSRLAVNDATKAATDVAGDVSAAAGRLQEQATEQIDRLSQTIRNKPLQSAAVAAGLGFVFAVIARR